MNNWNTVWKYELLRLPDLQHHWIGSSDRRQALRFVQYLQEYHRSVDVLDVSCGIGMKSSEIAKAGFTVLGTDASSIAIDGAMQQFATPNLTFLQAQWLDLYKTVQRVYGVVYHDCFSWIYEHEQLLACATEYLRCLQDKGGCFFFYAYADRTVVLERMKRDADERRCSNGWSYQDAQHTVKCDIHRQIGKDCIDVCYRFSLVDLNGMEQIREWAVLRQVYRWTFEDLQSVLLTAGFTTVEQIDQYGLCLARK